MDRISSQQSRQANVLAGQIASQLSRTRRLAVAADKERRERTLAQEQQANRERRAERRMELKICRQRVALARRGILGLKRLASSPDIQKLVSVGQGVFCRDEWSNLNFGSSGEECLCVISLTKEGISISLSSHLTPAGPQDTRITETEVRIPFRGKVVQKTTFATHVQAYSTREEQGTEVSIKSIEQFLREITTANPLRMSKLFTYGTATNVKPGDQDEWWASVNEVLLARLTYFGAKGGLRIGLREYLKSVEGSLVN